jgi:Kef-type K+ transport system membrane component KefB
VRSALAALGGVGLVLFLFLMGLRVDLSAARAGGRRLAAVSAGSVGVPFVLGVGAAVTVLAGQAPEGVGDVAFVAFVGTALSVSALPVLARLLDERGLTDSPVGQLVLASASVQDVVTWLLLAVSLALAGGGGAEVALALGGLVALVVLLALVRPVLAGPVARHLAGDDRDGTALGVVAAGLLGAGGHTQVTRQQAGQGALAFGVAFPREALAGVGPRVERTLGPLVRGVLLPVFFLVPGLGFSLEDLGGSSLPTIAVLLLAAMGGKLLGAGVPALLCGVQPRAAGAVAVLLNTRGLVELIVLGVALENGVIDPALYSELAVVALLTTFATGPVLRRIATDGVLNALPLEPERPRERERVAA